MRGRDLASKLGQVETIGAKRVRVFFLRIFTRLQSPSTHRLHIAGVRLGMATMKKKPGLSRSLSERKRTIYRDNVKDVEEIVRKEHVGKCARPQMCSGCLLHTDPQERAKTTTASSDYRPRPTADLFDIPARAAERWL